MGTDFESFFKTIVAEAEAEGPEAIDQLKAFTEHFSKVVTEQKIRMVNNPAPQKTETVKAKNVSVSVIQLDNGQLKVTGCTFTLPGTIGGDGRVMTHFKLDESHRKQIEKQFAKFLESLDFPKVGL